MDIDLVKQYVPEEWMTGAIIGVLLVYLLLRNILYNMILSRTRNANNLVVAHKSAYNFFIIITLFLVVTTGLLYVSGAAESTFKTFILLEMAVLYLVMILWQNEILLGSCNPLTTFLYLCGLEFVPTGLLIAANVCL